MSYHREEQDIYYIPPNFLTSGRLFGGMIRVRNAIEACVLVLLTGLPIISHSSEARKNEVIRENADLVGLRDFLLPMLMNGQVKVKGA